MNRRFVTLCAVAALLAACSESETPTGPDEGENLTKTADDMASGTADAGVVTTAGDTSQYCNFPAAAPAPGSSQTAFDTYSWAMFLSLNWVASSTERGVPDCSQPLTADGPRVWESWKTTSELFLPGAANPGSWESGWGSDAAPPKLSAKSKIAPQAQATLQTLPQQSAVLQPVGGWLIDQRGNPTYYQIASNQISYDYIVSNDLYNADTVKTFGPVNFPWQAAEIKASWRILEAADDASRYLTMTALVEEFDSQGNPTGNFVTETLGLVGLHVINKAPNFPQWVWATFEQIDNVDPNAPFSSYYDASATDPNQSPCVDHAFPCKPKPGASFTTPDPLTRLTPVTSGTEAVNASFQALFPNSFPKYYRLITTQRPTNPNDPGDPLGTPAPNISANVTMESYIQPTSSCMACHQIASGAGSVYRSDFSFLLLHAQPPAGGTSTGGSAAGQQ